MKKLCIALAAWLFLSGAALAQDGKVLLYADLLKLLNDKAAEAEILKQLEASPTIFTLSARQVGELEQAGASEALIAAIKAKQGKLTINPGLEINDLVVILDCSGSMLEKSSDPTKTKWDAAKPAVTKLLQDLPHGMNVGFVIYGHDKALGCDAVKVVRPLSLFDGPAKAELIDYVQGLTPVGGTPITLALRKAGEVLGKGKGPAAMVLITDGMDTCPKHGKPEDEAARLANDAKLNLKHGVTIVGFGLNDKEKAAVEQIAKMGKGTYYDAQTPDQLASATDKIAKVAYKPKAPETVSVGGVRAVKILDPKIEFPKLKEMQLWIGRGAVNRIVGSAKPGELLRIPNGTETYQVMWVPQDNDGEPVRLLTDLILAERKTIEVRPEEHLAMIQVAGAGAPKNRILVFVPEGGVNHIIQQTKKFGAIMVVPAGTYSIRVDDNTIEEGLKVEAGKLYKLE
jgi:Mg-chelatase subunit ChlD